jgi:L-lactate dehydrogenase complex protein LldG
MSSREAILSRIKAALADDAPREEPPVPELWPRTNPSTADLVKRFVEEIEAVTGEVIHCESMDDARGKLAKLLEELDCDQLGCTDNPLCRELTAGMDGAQLELGHCEPTSQELAKLTVGLVGADTLLADTGTCMVACPTPHERMMCYLPPVCIVIAKTDQLVEHMPQAWDTIAPRVADPELRGEFVFITGPSRTADIEKILILGVHGPKRLIVLLAD